MKDLGDIWEAPVLSYIKKSQKCVDIQNWHVDNLSFYDAIVTSSDADLHNMDYTDMAGSLFVILEKSSIWVSDGFDINGIINGRRIELNPGSILFVSGNSLHRGDHIKLEYLTRSLEESDAMKAHYLGFVECETANFLISHTSQGWLQADSNKLFCNASQDDGWMGGECPVSGYLYFSFTFFRF